MKRKAGKKQNKKTIRILTVAIVLVLLLDGLLIWGIFRPQSPGNEAAPVQESELGSTSPEESLSLSEPEAGETAPETEFLQFPVLLEEGNLTVLSLFQYSGQNPDCGNEEGTDVAGIILENTSEYHLTYAELELMTEEGILLRFVAEDIPAGKSAMVFSVANTAIRVDTICTEISCRTEYDTSAVLMEEQIGLTVTGTIIRVENRSGEDLTDVIVYYHNVMDPEYYGGTTYQYCIEVLPAGTVVEIDAVECFFGQADVVRIALKNALSAE